MKSLLLRRVSVIAAVVVIALSIAINKFLASQKEAPDRAPTTVEVPLVNTFKAEAEQSGVAINLTGRLAAVDKMEVYAEVTARLRSSGKLFREGAAFRKGEPLLSLDNGDSRMNLIAARAGFQSALTQIQADLATDYPAHFDAWSRYLQDFDPEKSLVDLPEVTDQKEKNFLVANNIYNQYYTIRSQELKHAKYTVYAPFDGVVHNANVTPGSLVRAGQRMGDFIGTASFEVEVGLNLSDRSEIEVNDVVKLTSADVDGAWTGVVNRIGQAIDPTTQTYKAYVMVEGEGLSEGMYLQAAFNGKAAEGSTRVPANLLIDDAFVYMVKQDSILIQQPVQVLQEEQGYVIVKGIPTGALLLSQALPGAHDGMTVRIAAVQN